MTRWTVPFNTHPAPSASPAQSAPPAPAASRKPAWCMRRAPAIGGATVEKPGMNLAITSDGMPQRMNRDSVWLTQEAGLMDSLHKPANTR